MKLLNINMKVVAFSFLLATTFWFFRAMSSQYTTNVDFSLVVDYDQNAYVQRAGHNDEVVVNVSGTGWSLLWAGLGAGSSQLHLLFTELPNKKYVLGSQLLPFFSDQITGLKANYVHSDTVRFFFESKGSRELALAFRSKQLNGTNFLNEVVFEPSSIQIEGPASVVAKYSDSLFLPLDIVDLKDADVSFDLADYLNKEITPSEEKAKVRYQVLIYKHEEVILPIMVPHFKDSSQFIRQQLSIECLVKEAVDPAELKEELSTRLKLDSLSSDAKYLIPYMQGGVEGVREMKIRPSKILLHED